MNEDTKDYAKIIWEINGKNLKKLRSVKGIKQEELAEQLGVSNSIISRVENGEMGLSAKHIGKLYALYNIKPSYFYEVDDSEALKAAKAILRNKEPDNEELTENMLKELQTFIGYLNAKYAKDGELKEDDK